MDHLTPQQTAEFLKKEPTAVFVDCRSEMEFLFVGHPVGAMMIPWNDGPDWDINPHFVGQVKKAAGHSTNRPVVLVCRSGNRSVDAGLALESAGAPPRAASEPIERWARKVRGVDLGGDTAETAAAALADYAALRYGAPRSEVEVERSLIAASTAVEARRRPRASASP